jgi:hypothetical protein
MPSKGFYSTQDGHWVPLIFPMNITGGKTAPAFAMKNYAHVSIVILIGANPGAPTGISVYACTDAAGDGAVAIPFTIFTGETSDVDILSGPIPLNFVGSPVSGNPDIFYVIELDAAQLPQGNPYVQLRITNGANADFASAIALLSGPRYSEDQSPTVLV